LFKIFSKTFVISSARIMFHEDESFNDFDEEEHKFTYDEGM